MNEDRKVERKILYYPTILVPSRWMKWALLYWDKVCSIVPEDWEDNFVHVHQAILPDIADFQFFGDYARQKKTYLDMKYLKETGEFEPIIPFDYGWEYWSYVLDDFKKIINTEEFQSLRNYLKNSGRTTFDWRLDIDRFPTKIYIFLQENNLIEKVDSENNWFYLEHETFLIYKALLAKYSALKSSGYLIPSTDSTGYEKMLFKLIDIKGKSPSLSAKYINFLPIPNDDVSFEQIIKFKKKRRDELLHFREEIIDNFEHEMSKAESQSDVKSIILKNKEKIEVNVSDLRKMMKDSKIDTINASFKSLINIKSPALLEAVASLLTKQPSEISIPLISSTAAIQLGYTWLDSKIKERELLRKSSFSYLYYATKKSLIF